MNDNVLGDLHDYHKEVLEHNIDWGRLVLDAIEEIERLERIVQAAKTVADYFPCTCWINQPKCPACQLLEALHND